MPRFRREPSRAFSTIDLAGGNVVTVHAGGAQSVVVRASGTATRLDVGIDGSADVELDQPVAREVRAAVRGSGQIAVMATDSLDASVAGNGVIRYGANRRVLSTSVTGSGAITPGKQKVPNLPPGRRTWPHKHALDA